MTNIPRETSCYSSSLLIKYAIRNGHSPAVLFNGIEEKRSLLENYHEWVDYKTWIKLAENYENGGGNLFKAGIEITQDQVTHFQLLILKIASFPFIINNFAEHFEKKISHTMTLKTNLRKNGLLDIVFRIRDKSKYSKQVCDFNKGCILATGQLKHLHNLELIELSCATNSNTDDCHYQLTWTPDPHLLSHIKEFFLFRFTNQQSILEHMEHNHNELQAQYNELSATKDFYGHIMQHMQEAVLWLDPSGKITFVNKGFLNLVRHYGPPEQVLGKDWTEFLSREEMRRIGRDLMKEVRETPGVPDSFDLMVRTAEGDERLGQTTFLWVESTRQKPGYLLTIRDITDKRVIERKLYAAENRYQTMYENSPAIIVGIDLSGNFLYANPAMEEQSGYSEKELKSMHFSQIVAPEGSGVDASAMLSQRTGGVNLQEMHYRAKNGEWKTLTLATFPLYDDKSVVAGLGGIGIDISETKRLNEMLIQTQRMELLGQLAGGLAHDFRNMLTVISGYTRLIEMAATDEKIKTFVGNIDIATERASALTKNLLTFSRGEEVRNEVFTANDIVNEVVKLLPPVLGRVCKLTLDMPDRKFRLKGDPGKLHQCLLNLSINARDAMKEKKSAGMVLTLRVKESPDPAWFLIEVDDTGPGIPPSIIERIFDPFFTTKKKGEGTGLGLSVVYGIVKSHGGVITVDSRPSEGACFIIKLPLAETAAPPKGRTVFVVDNDVVMRSTCVEILASRNYNVVQFNGMEDFSTWYDKNRPSAPADPVIALISARHFSIAEKIVATVKELSTVWICKAGETLPGNPKFVLRQPFAAAALIKTVEAVEMTFAGVGA